jgi:ATP adenylyltransferase
MEDSTPGGAVEQNAQVEGDHSSCRLCEILHGDSSADSFDSMWLADTDHKALISVGAMVPGWTLVCPTQHQVNLVDCYDNPTFARFTSSVLSFLERRHGKCAVFEHGAHREDSLTGCGVGHAHLHLVPVGFPLSVEALRFAPELNWRPCVASDIREVADGQEYLYVSDEYRGADTQGLLCILRSPVSQFFRKVIGHRIGLGEFFDYKKYPMLELGLASAQQLRGDVRASVEV